MTVMPTPRRRVEMPTRYTASQTYAGTLDWRVRRDLTLFGVCAQFGTVACSHCEKPLPACCQLNCETCPLLCCPCLTLI